MVKLSEVRWVYIFLGFGWLATATAAWAAGPVVAPAPGQSAVEKSAEKPGSLLSHRAVYTMGLSKVAESDGVRAASGTMNYTLTDRCEGYTIETDLSLSLNFSNGNENQIEQRYAAWEAKDGRSSTFRFQVVENGTVTKAYHGDIHFKDDGTGTITYDNGEVTTYDLPRGTLLSTAHTLALLRSAAAHEKFVSKTVVDGSFDQGPLWVTATIAPPHDGGLVAVKGDAANLMQGQYWPMSLAYFPASSKQTMPEYEINQNLLGTGVTRSMLQDFGGFALSFTPVKIEAIPAPSC
jgi:hypothetical protein